MEQKKKKKYYYSPLSQSWTRESKMKYTHPYTHTYSTYCKKEILILNSVIFTNPSNICYKIAICRLLLYFISSRVFLVKRSSIKKRNFCFVCFCGWDINFYTSEKYFRWFTTCEQLNNQLERPKSHTIQYIYIYIY